MRRYDHVQSPKLSRLRQEEGLCVRRPQLENRRDSDRVAIEVPFRSLWRCLRLGLRRE